MIAKFLNWTKNLIKYMRRGGVVYTNIMVAEHGKTLLGKTALITGASSGFGYAIASKFLSEGANVIITGRNEAKLKSASDSLTKSIGGNACIKTMLWDIEKISDLESKFNEAISQFGNIDIFINNAGIWHPHNFLSVAETVYDSILNINLRGLFFLMQKEAKYLIENNIHGKILNTTSVEGIQSDFTPYSASKWGANNLTTGLAKKLAQYGITVNAIAPGIALTDINLDLKKSSADNEYCPSHRTGRYVKVEEVAELAAFLASDRALNITGQIIAIDGGWSLR